MSQNICFEVFLKLIFVISRILGQRTTLTAASKKCYLQKTTCSTLIIETNKYEYIKNYFMILVLGNERHQGLVGVEH